MMDEDNPDIIINQVNYSDIKKGLLVVDKILEKSEFTVLATE